VRVWILSLMILLAGCSGSPSPVVDRAAQPAPEFTLQDLDGAPVTLSDSHGQVRLIDFWATWCAPCKEEIPWLIELHRTYGEQGFKIIAINPEETTDIVRTFVEAREIPYTNLAGTEEGFEAIRESYEVISYPTAFLIDGEGNIVMDFRGTKSKKVLERKIRDLLGLPPST
jgi:thiol-disulfide isomerase/thioredoxin